MVSDDPVCWYFTISDVLVESKYGTNHRSIIIIVTGGAELSPRLKRSPFNRQETGSVREWRTNVIFFPAVSPAQITQNMQFGNEDVPRVNEASGRDSHGRISTRGYRLYSDTRHCITVQRTSGAIYCT